MKPVRTYVINAITAAAVSFAAITSGAVPAAAKDDDMLKVLAGIAAVAVFAGAAPGRVRREHSLARQQERAFIRPLLATRGGRPEPHRPLQGQPAEGCAD